MKNIITAIMTLALVALLSAPLMADSESWVPGSEQLIAQANDAGEGWGSNAEQLIALANGINEGLVIKCDRNGQLQLRKTQE